MGADREARHDGEDDAPSMVDVLPDDVLMQVLSLLDMGSVLRARMACRRLRDLGAHPDVWRRRRLYPHNDLPVSLLKTVLRVAPCARVVNLRAKEYVYVEEARDAELVRELAALFRTTACAVEELDVDIERSVCLATVRNQLVRGRVRTLQLTLRWEPNNPAMDWPPDVCDLVRELFAVPKLTSLSVARRVVLPEKQLANFAPAGLVPPSLRQLTIMCTLPNGFVEFLLGSHYTTLEKLVLNPYGVTPPSATVMATLAAAPRLRSLCCGPWPCLTELRADGPLREITLHGLGPAAAAYLRTATLLERLELHSDDVDMMEGAVEAVASSGRSALRDVTIVPVADWENQEANLTTLSLALPSLRHLASLTLGYMPGDGFYAALSAQAVPQLKLLRVNLGFQQCAHDWMHSHGLLALLEELPQLRLVAGKASHCKYSEKKFTKNKNTVASHLKELFKKCMPCMLRCHIAVPRSEISRVAYQRDCCTFGYSRYDGGKRGGLWVNGSFPLANMMPDIILQ